MVELTDGPITFTLHLDGREEALKVVEPQMDVPLPEDGRLVVKENEAVWCDVRLETFGLGHRAGYTIHL